MILYRNNRVTTEAAVLLGKGIASNETLQILKVSYSDCILASWHAELVTPSEEQGCHSGFKFRSLASNGEIDKFNLNSAIFCSHQIPCYESLYKLISKIQ